VNEHQLRQKQAQEQTRRFLQALSAGQVGAVDRYGRLLKVGQTVLIQPELALEFQVTAVNPVLDPKVPPGYMSVTFSASFPLIDKANTPWMRVLIVKEPAEGAAGFVPPAEEPHEAEDADVETAGAPEVQEPNGGDLDGTDPPVKTLLFPGA
jgi:hypothetical protein